MLLFGSIAPGGGSGAQLWQLSGLAPANIELNTTAGADGINAVLPSAPEYGISLSNTALFPFEVSACYYFAGGILMAAGVANTPGGLFPFLVHNDFPNQLTSILEVTSPTSIEMRNNDNNSNTAKVKVVNSNKIESTLENSSGNVGGAVLVTLNSTNIEYYQLPTNVLLTQLIINSKISWQNGVGSVLFQINDSGEIMTNQTAPSIAPRIKTHEMPIFDQAGTLIGYIDIKT